MKKNIFNLFYFAVLVLMIFSCSTTKSVDTLEEKGEYSSEEFIENKIEK